jgi:hypothetical protein
VWDALLQFYASSTLQSNGNNHSILGEVVHPQNFNTLRRIEDEDGSVIEEQEQFAELVSSEFLLQNLKELLNRGMRQSLEDLPDGIHSGFAHQDAKGVFFYCTAQESRRTSGTKPTLGRNDNESKRQHFWRYIDLSEGVSGGEIEENRYLITNLIQCQPDTPRVVPVTNEVNIFELREKVIGSILRFSAEQAALKVAPKLLDPIQQTLATLLRSYLNHPSVDRKDVVAALQRINVPQPRVYTKAFKKAYESFTTNGQIDALLIAVLRVGEHTDSQKNEREKTAMIRREDLKLICFEYIWR